MIYKVGEKYDKAKGHQESAYFDISDTGGEMIFYFNRPTTDEINQFKSGVTMQVKLASFSESIILLTKFGDLNWMDMPYNPNLSTNLTHLHYPADGQGLAVNVMLFDTSNGELVASRLISFSDNFTRKLFIECEKLVNEDFEKDEYYRFCQQLFNKYSTKDLLNFSSISCKIS